jgi:hypothetical protein
MILIFDCSTLPKENFWQQMQHFVESFIFLLHEVGSCKEKTVLELDCGIDHGVLWGFLQG